MHSWCHAKAKLCPGKLLCTMNDAVSVHQLAGQQLTVFMLSHGTHCVTAFFVTEVTMISRETPYNSA